MILYLSPATSYKIYNSLFNEGKIISGFQSQRFNNNIIMGLSKFSEVISVSSLPYHGVSAKRLEEQEGTVKFISISNKLGPLHKIHCVSSLLKECKKIIKTYKIRAIICDSISLSHAMVAYLLQKKYSIPTYAIVTDVPEVMCFGKMDFFMRLDSWTMKRFKNYILLTKEMNTIVNKKNRPHIVIEGSYNFELADDFIVNKNNENKIILYSGSLWKDILGIENLIDAFEMVNVPNTELHFYGNGELTDYIISRQKNNNKVKYMGCVDKNVLRQKQKEAFLLVNPRKTTEKYCCYSFPSKTFEYMASGTALLMTKLPGIPAEYFNYVYLFSDETLNGMYLTLIDILNKNELEINEMGQRAKKFIYNNKNSHIQARKILDFIELNEKK